VANEEYTRNTDLEGASQLRDGDLLRLANFTNHVSPSLQVSFKAGKGRVFVAVLLGVEKKDQSEPLDVEAAMRRLGWVKERMTKVKPDAEN
jgi:hypothetical protein